MKPAGRYFSFTMAMLMLMMSIGITAHKMVCLVSGAITLSFLESKGCCPADAEDEAAAEAQCCDYSTDYFKLDIQTLVSSFNFKFDLAPAVFTIPVFIFHDFEQNIVSRVNHSPPLISGNTILSLISVFRI